MARVQPFLQVQDLEKRFGTTAAVAGVSFDVSEGEFLTLLGPSGCGKSTTLRCIAGLERPAQGRIAIGNELVTDMAQDVFVQPERRDVGMVFQFYALWPHLTVYENVAFPLRMRRRNRRDIQVAVDQTLTMVGLAGLQDRLPGSLSGGQQQRVALARALSYNPRVLLLDEPLSNLDARLRERMRVEISRLQKRLKITTVYVTHDQVEAMVMSDRVAVMHNGRIHQIAPPREVYEHPADVIVAGFVGVANLLEGHLVSRRGEGSGLVTLGSGSNVDLECSVHENVKEGDPVTLVLRPEALEIVRPEGGHQPNTLEGTVMEVLYLGGEMELRVTVLERDLKVKASTQFRAVSGDVVSLRVNPVQCIAILSARRAEGRGIAHG